MNTKTKNEIKKELLRLTLSAQWVIVHIEELTNEALEYLNNGSAKTINDAAFKAIDACY
ncbi:hypothetical protein [Paenibacillus sp. L3-i20]|uniref:hypothetical protein n=1 Tax=Paenibacillus sp. L3-i20 TaxID=2905833 RepID=UPI001EDEED64|nr:hypothetical protein [Paenibacillus sp. L3-i20]GKU76854.1 hypothetical protein L3i20_v212510 [Paenibacillus sp. L3-i20]